MRDWSDAQIEAMLELEGLGQRIVTPVEQRDSPLVKRGCICPNGHQPDKNGLVVTSPSCELHGYHYSKLMLEPRSTRGPARTVGVIHHVKGYGE